MDDTYAYVLVKGITLCQSQERVDGNLPLLSQGRWPKLVKCSPHFEDTVCSCELGDT